MDEYRCRNCHRPVYRDEESQGQWRTFRPTKKPGGGEYYFLCDAAKWDNHQGELVRKTRPKVANRG